MFRDSLLCTCIGEDNVFKVGESMDGVLVVTSLVVSPLEVSTMLTSSLVSVAI